MEESASAQVSFVLSMITGLGKGRQAITLKMLTAYHFMAGKHKQSAFFSKCESCKCSGKVCSRKEEYHLPSTSWWCVEYKW